MKMFVSDNASGVHPEVMKAILDCNNQHVMPYGNDDYTRKATKLFKEVFGENTDVAFVLTGTGANVIGLSSLIRPFESVITAQTSHVNVDECSAFERFSGSKIELINCSHGKLTPELIQPFLMNIGNEHHAQPRVVSISQVTEMGTVYTVDEIRSIADFSHDNGMLLHMDGARIANAAASLDISFKTMTTDAGVDLLSFGGTKNGMMMGEAIVSFNPELTRHLKYVRKQGMHLASKMRYISAQFTAYLKESVWNKNATHANRMATILANAMGEHSEIRFVAKAQANIIFAEIPKSWNKLLQETSAFYIINEQSNLARFVTSFDTQDDEVREFIETLNDLAHG